MIKPTGSVCNLDCKNSIYLEKEKLYPQRKANYRMSEDTLELFIKQHIAAQDVDEVIFAWQGGEPTLMGLPFFRRAVELQQIYAGEKTIINTFQTNGILIDNEWAIFLSNTPSWWAFLLMVMPRYMMNGGLLVRVNQRMRELNGPLNAWYATVWNLIR